jgi:hypothetical protein
MEYYVNKCSKGRSKSVIDISGYIALNTIIKTFLKKLVLIERGVECSKQSNF